MILPPPPVKFLLFNHLEPLFVVSEIRNTLNERGFRHGGKHRTPQRLHAKTLRSLPNFDRKPHLSPYKRPRARTHAAGNSGKKKGSTKQEGRTAILTIRPFAYSKRDLNPHSHHWPRDFKSLVSTDSTIRAPYGAAKIRFFCYTARGDRRFFAERGAGAARRTARKEWSERPEKQVPRRENTSTTIEKTNAATENPIVVLGFPAAALTEKRDRTAPPGRAYLPPAFSAFSISALMSSLPG